MSTFSTIFNFVCARRFVGAADDLLDRLVNLLIVKSFVV
jgi:hypothetical protein